MGKPVVDEESDVGTTFSKYSRAVTQTSEYAGAGEAAANDAKVVSNMDEGAPVLYDPINGSFPEGTLPGLSKLWGKKDEGRLRAGWSKPEYTDDNAPTQDDF